MSWARCWWHNERNALKYFRRRWAEGQTRESCHEHASTFPKVEKQNKKAMHLHTVVKVRAKDEKEAIERVNDLLTGSGEYRIEPFDWVAEDETKISEEVKTAADFLTLREMEREEHDENMRRAEIGRASCRERV